MTEWSLANPKALVWIGQTSSDHSLSVRQVIHREHNHVVASSNPIEFASLCQKSKLFDNGYGYFKSVFPIEPAKLLLTRFPAQSCFVGNKFFKVGWSCSASSNRGIWFGGGYDSDINLWLLPIKPQITMPIEFDVVPPLDDLANYLSREDSTQADHIRNISLKLKSEKDEWYWLRSELSIRPGQLLADEDDLLIEWHYSGDDLDLFFWTRYTYEKASEDLRYLYSFDPDEKANKWLNHLGLWPSTRIAKEGSHSAESDRRFSRVTTFAFENQILICRLVLSEAETQLPNGAITGVLIKEMDFDQEKMFIPTVPKHVL